MLQVTRYSNARSMANNNKVPYSSGVAQCDAGLWIWFYFSTLLFVLICDIDDKWLTLKTPRICKISNFGFVFLYGCR